MTKIVKKPWGNFEQFTHNKKSTVKIITVLPKRKLSLQYHTKREEYWRILEGNCKIQIGDRKYSGKTGDSFFVGKKEKHRIVGGNKTSKILEISLGNFDEKDIVRIEDDYGRK
jgi:mannose-6-phosphate isomerase